MRLQLFNDSPKEKAEELNPCPFCGEKPKMKEIWESYGMDGSYKDILVYCPGCGCKMRFNGDEFYGRKPTTYNEIVERWNHRV